VKGLVLVLEFFFTNIYIFFVCFYRDLLFGNIYDTFSSEDNLSKAVFLEHLCRVITSGKLSFLRTVVAKDFIGKVFKVTKMKSHYYINVQNTMLSWGSITFWKTVYFN